MCNLSSNYNWNLLLCLSITTHNFFALCNSFLCSPASTFRDWFKRFGCLYKKLLPKGNTCILVCNNEVHCRIHFFLSNLTVQAHSYMILLRQVTDESDIADWKNHPTFKLSFVATLVEWHRNGAWAMFQKSKSNWHYLSLHMTDKCQVNLKWEQYRSKFYNMESE